MNYPTWSDLNNKSIVPPLGSRREPDIGSVGILVSCKPDINLIKSQIKISDESSFFNSTLITSKQGDKGICIAGPYIGAPYGSMLLESLIAVGIKKVIVLGWCGAVSEKLNVGDILIPQRAIVDEGTSHNYQEATESIFYTKPDMEFSDQLSKELDRRKMNHLKSTIWSTDAIYRETKKKVDLFKNLGADAVEMECSALFAVAHYRQIQIGAALVVSDSVASKDWDPGFRNKKFKTARRNVCEAMIAFAKNITNND